MWAIIRRTIKDRKVGLIVYSVSGIFLLWMYVALFPSFSAQADNMREYMESFPEGFMKAFGLEDFDMSTIERFLATEQYSFVWPILALFFVVSLAGSGIAGEIERGTAEIMLSQPVSRLKLYWSRYLSGVLMFIVFLVISVFSVFPLSEMHSVEYITENHLTLGLAATLFGLAIFSIAMMLSAIFSERSKVYMMTGGMVVGMYVLNIVSVLKDSLADLKYLSFFYYFNSNDALIRNTIDSSAYWVFGITIVVCSVAGAYFFIKKDIKTV